MKKGWLLMVVAMMLGCAPYPDFWLGADISGTTEMEQHGGQLFNAKGEPRENTALMKELGLNAIRLRVWVNPQDSFCSKEDVLDMALRAKELDMPVMIDFHYSDWWADPGKQIIPEAWLNMDYNQMRVAAAEHTYETLQLLKQHAIDVRWIQIGNETTHGFLWPMARAEENMANYAGITDTCYAAAKAIYPNAACIVHLDCGSDMKRYRFILDGLKKYDARYDMVGMSMYPYWDQVAQLITHEDQTLERIVANIDSIYHDYCCETMITEFGYESLRPDEGYAYLLKSILTLRDSTNGHCKGLFYWAPELEIGYPLGAFHNHRPTHIMDAFRDSHL